MNAQANVSEDVVNTQSYQAGATKSAIRELAAYAAKQRRALGEDKVFDFSIGNPSVPAPLCVKASLEKNIQKDPLAIHGYTPAAGLTEARTAVADSLNRRFATAYTFEDLYLTCGAAASVSIALNACVSPQDEVIVIAPYFPEYRVWIEAAGARCVEVLADTQSFDLDISAIQSAINSRTRAIIINSPNNPVGVVYPSSSIEALRSVLDEAQKTYTHPIFVISDEPYREITYGADVPWIPKLIPQSLVCYSYSKSLSLPGERIGWVLIPSTNPYHDVLVSACAGAGRKLGFVCAPALFQRVLIDCVDAPAPTGAYEENKRALTNILDSCGFSYIEPQGAFYLWMKSPLSDAREFSDVARTFNVMLVPSNSFGTQGWVRLGYCADHAMIKRSYTAFAHLRAALDERSHTC